MAFDCSRSAGVHWLRRGTHELLGPAGRVARGENPREQAVNDIERRYREFVDTFEGGK